MSTEQTEEQKIAHSKFKLISVDGDRCLDWLIYDEAQSPPLTKQFSIRNWQNSRHGFIQTQQGGALLLTDFLKQMFLKKETTINGPPNIAISTRTKDRIHSITEVRKFVKKVKGKDKTHYRVYDYKGFCGPKESKDIPNTDLGENGIASDMIVIDDVGNGYRDKEHNWIKKVERTKNKPWILHKINWPLQDNNLLTRIDEKLSDHHIIIITADDIRKSGIQLSSRISWDQTIEDLLHGFKTNAKFNPFKKCAHFIIRIGLEGVVHLWRDKSATKEDCCLDGYRVRFHYFPEKMEGRLDSEIAGTMQGMGNMFAAAFVTSFSDNEEKIFRYEQEYLKDKNIWKKKLVEDEEHLDVDQLFSRSINHGILSAINFLKSGYEKKDNTLGYPANSYVKTIDPSLSIIILDKFLNKKESRPTILYNQLCGDGGQILPGALELARTGKVRGAITSVPFAQFRHLRTADRDEVESYRSVRNLMSEYLSDPSKMTPLSMAVFGSPGSGKSFGVKQIASTFKGQFEILEFNLSQFNSIHELTRAFHEIRDINLMGNIPLVFFDEFDSAFGDQKLGWLKYFLAPMQDGTFKEGEKDHPIGRGVFIFAGATSYTLQQFIKPKIDDPDKAEIEEQKRKELKVPDFVSRLRGYINIKGIDCAATEEDDDNVYLIRRAIVLYHQLSLVKGIKNEKDEIIIDPDLLRTLLRIKKLKHGARSLGAIIGMSQLKNQRIFSRSCLPPNHLLEMHLDIDVFEKELNKYNNFYEDSSFIIKYAKEAHKGYREAAKAIIEKDKKLSKKIQQAKIDANASLNEWSDLSPDLQNSNREQALSVALKLNVFNFRLQPMKGKKYNGIKIFDDEVVEEMAKMEHERWMIEKQRNGWSYGHVKNEHKDYLTNPSLLPWDELTEKTKELDREPIKKMPDFLEVCKWEIVKAE